jgi:hypothetical protein
MVATLSVYSFLTWLLTFTSSSRLSFIKRYLKVNDRLSYVSHHHSGSTTSSSSHLIDGKILDAFLFEYLKHDGVFLLRIVKKNTNDIVVGELVCALWDHFKRYPRFAIQTHQDNEKLNEGIDLQGLD